MNKKVKEVKGITLIALVVTIVVLLILATVSIQMLGGDQGIIKQAVDAKDKTTVAKEKESISLAKAAIKSRGQEINQENLQKELDAIEGEGKTTVSLRDDLSGLDIYFVETKNKYSEDVGGYEISDEEASYWSYEENEDGTITLTGFQPPEEKVSGITELIIPNKLFGKQVKQVGAGYIGYGCYSNIWRDGERTQYGCGQVSKNSTIKSIWVQDGIEVIEESAFVYGEKIEKIRIPNTVTTIADRVFCECSDLISITIPKSVVSIEYSAFAGCSSLTSINIPNRVINVGECAFDRCTNLTTINLEATSIPSGWDSNWKGNCTATVNLGVSM